MRTVLTSGNIRYTEYVNLDRGNKAETPKALFAVLPWLSIIQTISNISDIIKAGRLREINIELWNLDHFIGYSFAGRG